jgi:hypothetical protein
VNCLGSSWTATPNAEAANPTAPSTSARRAAARWVLRA